MGKSISVEFKYEIGDVLCHKGDLVTTGGLLSRFAGGPRYVVLARSVEECPGGVQQSYVCDMISGDGRGPQRMLVAEHALLPWSEMEKANEGSEQWRVAKKEAR